MKRAALFIFLQSVGLAALLAQSFADDFSGASLAPHWLGQTDAFVLQGGRLQLNNTAPASNNVTTLYALAPTSTGQATTWQFKVQCDFSPSTSNFARIYLAASQPPVDGASLDGYYLQVGGISGNDDALELYRQDGSASTLLISGTTGAVGTDPVLVSVVVTRSTAGEWALEADYTGGEDYEPQGSAIDATHALGQYVGLYCRYTSTRNMAFFFDDILVNPLYTDTDAPLLTGVTASAPDALLLVFNEPVVLPTAGQFSLSPGALQPAMANGISPAEVELRFSQPLSALQAYTLTASNISDLNGNTRVEQAINFTFFFPEIPVAGDIVITEIMADPSPQVGLPNAEYLEIFNSTDKVLALGGLELSVGSSSRTLDDYDLFPGQYLLLCDDANAAALAAFGDVLELESFPSLTNESGNIQLNSADGQLLDALAYTLDWYQADPIRSDGGYSLERIDKAGPSDCANNWRPSLAPAGGTPGENNSVDGQSLDVPPPSFRYAVSDSPTVIYLVFDTPLEVQSNWEAFFSISPDIGIGSVRLNADDARVLELLPISPMQSGILYEVRIDRAGLMACLGQTASGTIVATAGLSEPPETGDVLINEVLFNPYTGGVDFVELYNASSKILFLQNLQLRNEAITSGTLSVAVASPLTLLPGGYLVLTPEPENIWLNYPTLDSSAIFRNPLPSLADDEGNLTVYSADFELLDALDYSADWHSPLLSDEDGVSLERLRPTAATNERSNWYSAASTVGYATPGLQNSQYRATTAPTDDAAFFTLGEQTVSPDGDGFQDVLEIHYTTDGPGYLAQARIFDVQGRPVVSISQVFLLAGRGTLIWEGLTDDGVRARTGIYVLFAEVFTPEGDTRVEKLTFVVAGKQ